MMRRTNTIYPIIIKLIFTIFVFFFANNIIGQNINSLPDTLKESDVFGSRNMKMLVIEGIGEDRRKLADQKDLSAYFDFTGEVEMGQSADLIAKCLTYYTKKLEDRYLELDLSFIKKTESAQEKYLSLQENLKLFYKQGFPEKRTGHVYKIERYLLMLQKNKITPSKIYRAKKAIMMGNPILAEVNVNENMFSTFSSVGLDPLADFTTILLIGYDTTKGFFQAVTANGIKISISFDDFMKNINKGYVIIPQQINN